MSDKHAKYLNLLNGYQYQHKELLWGRILYTRIWSAINSNLLSALYSLFKSVLVTTYNTNNTFSKNEILLVRNIINRKDYNEIWNNMKSIVGTYDLIEIERKRKINFNFFRNLYKYLKIIKEIPKEIAVKDRLYLSSWIIRITNSVSVDFEELQNTRLIILFFDGDPIENYLCQQLKLCLPNSSTVTLQHGQYLYIEDRNDINQTGIRNLTADYIFSWGEFTENQFLKAEVDKERILKVGGLLNNSINYLETQEVLKEKGVFGVVCDSPSFSFSFEKNKEMINIANELSKILNMNFWVKLHPFDNKHQYIMDCSNEKFTGFYPQDKLMKEFAKEVDFNLIHASSAYIDLLTLQCKSFKYNSSISFPLVENKFETFRGLEDLILNVKEWTLLSSEERKKFFEKNKNYYLENIDASVSYTSKILELLKRNKGN